MKQLITKLFFFLNICLLSSVSSLCFAENTSSDEALIKAAFIFNFAKLTTWPENTWGYSDAPLVLCTAGDDGLVTNLKRLSGKVIQGHPVTIQALKGTQDSTDCHVLYIATTEKQRVNNLLSSTAERPILTISEITDFAISGGVIKLYDEQKRTRFKINLEVANKVGLKISSRLLSMAVVIGKVKRP